MIIACMMVMAASVFAEGKCSTIRKNNEEYSNGDISELELLTNDDGTSFILMSYKENECSKIEIFIDIESARANELYNIFNNMLRTELREHIFDDFTKYSEDYLYDESYDIYYVEYSLIGVDFDKLENE